MSDDELKPPPGLVWRACPKHRVLKTVCLGPKPHKFVRDDNRDLKLKPSSYPGPPPKHLRERKTPRNYTPCSWHKDWWAELERRMGKGLIEMETIEEEPKPSPANWGRRPENDELIYDTILVTPISTTPDFPPPHLLPGKRQSKRPDGTTTTARKRSRSDDPGSDQYRKRRMPRAGSIGITPPPGTCEPDPAPLRVLREKRQGKTVYRHETDIDSGADPTQYGPRLIESTEDSDAAPEDTASEYAPDSDSNQPEDDEEGDGSPFEDRPRDSGDEGDLYSLLAPSAHSSPPPRKPPALTAHPSSRSCSPSTQHRSEEEESLAAVAPPTPEETPAADPSPERETVYISSSPSRSPSPVWFSMPSSRSTPPSVDAWAQKRGGYSDDDHTEWRGPGSGKTRWRNSDNARWRDSEKARGRFSGPRKYTPLITVGDGKRPWEVVGEGVRLGEEIGGRRRRSPSPEL